MVASGGGHVDGTLRPVPEYLIATDAAGVFDDFRSVLAGPGSTVRWVKSGPDVVTALKARPADLAIIDLQIGSMGGIAVYLDLRMEGEAGRVQPLPALVVLDRRADVFIARRASVEGWIIKPLDPIRIRRATSALLNGETWYDTSYLPDPVAVPVPSGSIPETGK